MVCLSVVKAQNNNNLNSFIKVLLFSLAYSIKLFSFYDNKSSITHIFFIHNWRACRRHPRVFWRTGRFNLPTLHRNLEWADHFVLVHYFPLSAVTLAFRHYLPNSLIAHIQYMPESPLCMFWDKAISYSHY